MKKALFIICAVAAMKVELYACLGCSRLEVLESSVPLRVSDDGTFRGQITTMNFTGDLQVTRIGNTAIVTYSTPTGGAGGGDNFGSHKATKAVDMAGFAIANTSGISNSSVYTGASMNVTSFTASHVAASSISNTGNYTGANMTVTSFTASHVTATGTYHGNAVYLENTVGAANAGTPVGFGRAFNFTGSAVGNVTQSGATFTVTLNDTTGGGGSSIRPYRIVVGTLTAADVDIASDTVDGLNEALRRLGAAGLTDSTTAVGFIFYKEGIYTMSGATIPVGITVFAANGSSTVWRTNNQNSGIATIYGTLDGFSFDINAVSYQTDMLVFKSSSTLRNFKVRGAENFAGTGSNHAMFLIKSAKRVRIHDGDVGIVNNGTATSELGEGAAVEIYGSTNVYIERLYIEEQKPGTSNTDGFISISTSSDIRFSNNYIERSGDIFMGIHSKVEDVRIEHNVFNITKTGDARGYLAVWDDTFNISTGIVFNGNRFNVLNVGSSRMIALGQCTDNVSSPRVYGVVISNNIVTGNTNSWIFTEICNTQPFGTVLNGNHVFNAGSFITQSFSGTATYSGNDNFFNGVEQ